MVKPEPFWRGNVMDTDLLVERLWQRIRDPDSLPPDYHFFGAGYQILRARLDTRDEGRAKEVLRSLVRGFGSSIEVAKTDPDDRYVSVWAPVDPTNPLTPQSRLAASLT